MSRFHQQITFECSLLFKINFRGRFEGVNLIIIQNSNIFRTNLKAEIRNQIMIWITIIFWIGRKYEKVNSVISTVNLQSLHFAYKIIFIPLKVENINQHVSEIFILTLEIHLR